MNLGTIRVGMLVAAFACLVVGGVWTAGAGPQTDGDGDGTPDFKDNCTTVSNAAQIDSNGDGYGNRCDADFSNTGTVGVTDLSRALGDLGLTNTQAGFNPDVDIDSSGAIGVSDLSFTLSSLGFAPGPSACVPTACPS